MNRNITVSRIWSMGSFNNYQLQDELTDIPERIALNPEAMGLLYNLITMEMESAHVRYLKLYKDHPALVNVFPEIMKYFDELNIVVNEDLSRTYDEFMKVLNKEQGEQ
jgi:hypothetical protein